MKITKIVITLATFLLYLIPTFSHAQDACDPAYTEIDYKFYALDAALANDFDTAYALYDCWAQAYPEDQNVLLESAAVRAIEGDYEGALADLDNAEQQGSRIVPLRRAYVFVEMGEYQDVIDTLPAYRDSLSFRLPEIDMVLNLAYRQRGIARVDAENYAAGLEDLMTAYNRVGEDELTPEDAPAVLAIATAFRMTGDLETAAQAYTTYVRIAGDDADPDIVALVARLNEIGVEAFATDPAEPADVTGGWFD